MLGQGARHGMAAPEAKQITLADGRTLAFREAGAPDGKPLVYCHGFPSSRREAGLAAAMAQELGLRLIAPDRPGFGRSSFHAHRRIGQWPADLAALVDALKIPRFSVLGISGGGPYALACAAALPHRLENVTVVCGMGPAEVFAGSIATCSAVTRLTFGLARAAPTPSRLLCAGLGTGLRLRPQTMLNVLTRSVPASDHITLARPDVGPALAASMAEAVRTGSRGAWWELQLFTRPWDFDLSRIRLPVRLWHGEPDTVVPVESGRFLAKALPRCEATFLPDVGHYALPVNHQRAILEELAGGG